MHPVALRRLAGAINRYEHARKFTTEDRERLAKSGAAMSDGGYPIENQGDLDNAVNDYNRTGQPPAVKAHIVARAKALNLRPPFQDN